MAGESCASESFGAIAAGRGAFLDARAAIGEEFKDKFPTVYAICLSAGIDPAKELIPITPAEHYHMGGVYTDARGRTSLAGLWAAGEVACTGVHGANRLASNSLLEAVVFAARIAEDVGGLVLPVPALEKQIKPSNIIKDERGLEAELRGAMALHVGVVRNAQGMKTALKIIAKVAKQADSLTLRNMATSAFMITSAALHRQESRGGHFRSDFPLPNPALARRSHFTLAQARKISGETQ